MSVTVTIGNGNIGGVIADSDGCVGIIITGATEGTVTAGTPFLVTNQAEITALNLTSGNNAAAVKFFNEVIAETKLLGINQFELYVQLMSSATKIHTMCDVSQATGASKLVDFSAGKIRVLMAISDDDEVYPSGTGLVTTNGINADCYTAATNLQALLASYAALPKNWPMRGVIGCTNFTGTASSLTDVTQNTTNRVMMFIGDTASGVGCSLGIVAGRIIALPVQRKISRKLDGPISSSTAYIGTATADQYASTSTIGSKGFVTFKKYTSTNGFFFTSDQTACPTTDDYHFMCRGRVIDKGHRIAVAVYEEETDNEVDTNDDGTIDANNAKSLEGKVEAQCKTDMTARGNCKEVIALVDATQNVETTSQVNIDMQVKGKGYTTNFNIGLGFKPQS